MPNYLSPGVYVEEVEAGSRPIEGVGTAVAAFVGLAEKGPMHEPTLVSNWTQFAETFGDFMPGTYLAHAVYGFFQNGGSMCLVVRVGGSTGGSGDDRPPERAELPADRKALAGRLPRRGARRASPSRHSRGARGKERQDRGVRARRARTYAEDMFTLVVVIDGKVAENFDNVSTKEGDASRPVRNAQSKLVKIEATAPDAALAKVARGGTDLVAPAPAAPAPPPSDLGAEDYVGDVARRTGFSGLEAIDEVTMVAVPDLVAVYEQGIIDLEGLQAVQLAMIAHCELMGDRVAILDAPPGLNPQQVQEWRVEKAGYDSKYATLYWPWVKVFDPLSPGPTCTCRRAAMSPASGPATTTPAACTRPRPTRSSGRDQPADANHQGRARPAEPQRDQLHPGLPRARRAGVGSADAVQRPGLALPQRAPAVQLHRGVDRARHPVGGLRAQRPRAVVAD